VTFFSVRLGSWLQLWTPDRTDWDTVDTTAEPWNWHTQEGKLLDGTLKSTHWEYLSNCELAGGNVALQACYCVGRVSFAVPSSSTDHDINVVCLENYNRRRQEKTKPLYSGCVCKEDDNSRIVWTALATYNLFYASVFRKTNRRRVR